MGYKQPSPFHISIYRVCINYITPKEYFIASKKIAFVFDRCTYPSPRTSVFGRLEPIKRKYKCQGTGRKIEEYFYAKDPNFYKSFSSVIPSRMRQETKVLVSFEDVLKLRTHIIVHTKECDKDLESVGSSYRITIYEKEGTLQYVKIEDEFVNINTCHHISFNDGDTREIEDAKDAPSKLKKGVRNTINALKEVNLGTDKD